MFKSCKICLLLLSYNTQKKQIKVNQAESHKYNQKPWLWKWLDQMAMAKVNKNLGYTVLELKIHFKDYF